MINHGNILASCSSSSASYVLPERLSYQDSLAKYRQLFAALLVQPSDYKIMEEVGEGKHAYIDYATQK